MFNADFYPTPKAVIDTMLSGFDLVGRTVLEPSAGKGDILDAIPTDKKICCELNPDLAEIAKTKAKFLKPDFLQVLPEEISHVDYIVMNPPFSADEKHILHAWNIAPEGCTILALCNDKTLENTYSHYRERLSTLVKNYGKSLFLGKVFQTAERSTNVDVSFITLYKPKTGGETEFEGFFTYETELDEGISDIMPYNEIRNIVNRFVGAVKLYDEVLETAVKMNALISELGANSITFTCTQDQRQVKRAEFKTELQKQSWKTVFRKLDMEKYTTHKLMGEINKFVEQQQNVPFTMQNIYQMFRIIMGTHSGRQEKMLAEVFDRITQHYTDNRLSVEGWKTNSQYMVNKTFILAWIAESTFSGKPSIRYEEERNLADLHKALCHVTGTEYKSIRMTDIMRKNNVLWGQWFDWGFFQVKVHKKRSAHFKFKSDDVHQLFNKMACKAKGWQLPYKTTSDFRKKSTMPEKY